MNTRIQGIRFLAVLALTVALAGVCELANATSAYAQADSYKTVSRLGGSTRFDAPLKDAAAVQKWAARKRAQTGIAQVLEKAGIPQLAPTVIDILSKASPDQLKETEVQPGTAMVWMAFRRGGTTPEIVRNVKWTGRRPFQGFTFVIDDMVQTYTFVVPKPCANLTLLTSEPSREKARLDAERAERERLEKERLDKERAAAEAARLEAERRERERLEQERLEKERLEKERLEQERLAAEAERARLEAERLAAEQKAKWDIFAAGLFGKERRTREIDGTSAGTVLESLCSPLAGVKFGAEYKAAPNFKIAPAVGVAINFEETSYTSLFAEVEANLMSTSGKSFVGVGAGIWDFTHSDYVKPSILVHAGQQIWTNAKMDKLFIVGEGRLFPGSDNGIDNNYMFWAGLRYVIR
jgi:hypothetical protein